jgi:endoglucanase
MNRLHCLTLSLATALSVGSALCEPLDLKRGLNLGLWHDWRTIGEMLGNPAYLKIFPEWQRDVTPRMLEVLVEQGFDFVRMPVDPGPLLAYGPGERQDHLIAKIHSATEVALAAGLKVVVDLHPLDRGDETGGIEDILGDLWPDYVVLVGRIAAELGTLPADKVALEPLNEPTFDCDAVYSGAPPRWPEMQAQLHAAARAAAPDLTIVLTGACWGQANALASLDPAVIDDDTVLWTFHSYEPFAYSHQGATWSSSPEKYLWDLPYPPTLMTPETAERITAEAEARMTAAEGQADTQAIAEKIAAYAETLDSAVTDEIARAAAWADEHGIPRDRLLLGEFGALHTVDGMPPQPREWYLAFLADKRRAAKAAGMSWAVLGYVGGMGVTTAEAPDRRLTPETCAALGLPCGD